MLKNGLNSSIKNLIAILFIVGLLLDIFIHHKMIAEKKIQSKKLRKHN